MTPALVGGLLLALGALASCGDDGGADSVTLVTYDSFPDRGTPLNEASPRSPRRPGSTSSCWHRRRRRHDGLQGGAHRRQPGGRRDVRRRQHVPVRVVDEEVIEPYEADGWTPSRRAAPARSRR